jgi:hypothetical protein
MDYSLMRKSHATYPGVEIQYKRPPFVSEPSVFWMASG